jgi:hypothetical protein
MRRGHRERVLGKHQSRFRHEGQHFASRGLDCSKAIEVRKGGRMFAVPGIPPSADNSRVVADVAPHFCSAYSTAQAIRAELCRFRAAEKPDVLVISKRPEYFDVSDLFDHKANVGSVRFVTSVDDLYRITNQFALAIVFQHAWEEYEFTFHLRAKGLAPWSRFGRLTIITSTIATYALTRSVM